jgi:hypothetical protein
MYVSLLPYIFLRLKGQIIIYIDIESSPAVCGAKRQVTTYEYWQLLLEGGSFFENAGN